MCTEHLQCTWIQVCPDSILSKIPFMHDIFENSELLPNELLSDEFAKDILLQTYIQLRYPDYFLAVKGIKLIPSGVQVIGDSATGKTLDEFLNAKELMKLPNDNIIPLNIRLQIACNIAEALKYLHTENICYPLLVPSQIIVYTENISTKPVIKLMFLLSSKLLRIKVSKKEERFLDPLIRKSPFKETLATNVYAFGKLCKRLLIPDTSNLSVIFNQCTNKIGSISTRPTISQILDQLQKEIKFMTTFGY